MPVISPPGKLNGWVSTIPARSLHAQPQVMQAIKSGSTGWDRGRVFSATSRGDPQAVDLLELEAVQLPMFTDGYLQELHRAEVPVLLEVILETPGELAAAGGAWRTRPFMVAGFSFDKNGIGWEQLDEQVQQQLQTLQGDYPIILSMDFDAAALEEMLESVQPYGINVRGGAEEKVGFKIIR